MASSNDLASRLRTFYQLNNPEKLVNVEGLALEWRGREPELWSALSERYGAEAVRTSAVATLCKDGFSSGVQEEEDRKDPAEAHAEVLSEIVLANLIATNSDEDMRQRETNFSTSSHIAICAHRILMRLSVHAKKHLKANGGLRLVVEKCGPDFVVWTEPGTINATSRSIFVLIDRALLSFLKSQLEDRSLYALDYIDSVNQYNTKMTYALLHTNAWRAVVAESYGVVENEIHWLRDMTRRVQTLSLPIDISAHLSEVEARILDKEKRNIIRCSSAIQREITAQLGTDLIDLFEALTKACIATTKPKSSEEESVRRLVHFARRLVGLDSLARNRLFSGSLDRIMQASKVNTNEDDDEDDCVEIVQPPKQTPDVVDLTGDDQATEIFQTRSCRDSDFEDDESDGEHDDNLTEKSVHFKDSRGRKRRSGRPSDVDALLARAATRGRGESKWRASQAVVLAKRMDRAIWDAFRHTEFEPLLSLLDHGASANYTRLSRETALMAAAYCGREDVAKTLLDKGADPAATDSQGNTAVILARAQGHNQLADLIQGLILDKSINIDTASTQSQQEGLSRPPETGDSARASKRRRGDDSYIQDDQHHEEEIIISQPALASQSNEIKEIPSKRTVAAAASSSGPSRQADDDFINRLLLRK